MREVGKNDLILFEDIDASSDIVKRRDSSNPQQEVEDSDSDDSDDSDDEDESIHDRSTFAKSRKISKAQSKVTLSGVLEALDGVGAGEGYLLFMTSNHPEMLDPALLRPGRIDQKIVLDLATTEQLKRMFIQFFSFYEGEEAIYDVRQVPILADIFANNMPDKVFSPAQAQEYLTTHQDNPKQAILNIPEWISQETKLTVEVDKVTLDNAIAQALAQLPISTNYSNRCDPSLEFELDQSDAESEVTSKNNMTWSRRGSTSSTLVNSSVSDHTSNHSVEHDEVHIVVGPTAWTMTLLTTFRRVIGPPKHYSM